MKKYLLLIFSLLFISSPLFAEENSSESKETKVKVKVGLENITGNINIRSINVGFNVSHTAMPWRNVLIGEFTKTTFGSEVAEHESSLSYKSDYYLNDEQKKYVFAYLAYENDDFTNIDNRYTEAIGYGQHVIKNKQHKLDVELGAGFRQTNHVRELEDDRGAIGYIGLNYTRQLTKKIKINQDVNYLFGKVNNFTKLTTDLNIDLTKHLSLSLVYELDNNSTVSSDIKNTNTSTETNLVYSF